MFAYNKLSDLLTGELVVPLKKTQNGILCLNKDLSEVFHDYDEFDFEKSECERYIEVEDSSDEETPTPKEYNFDSINDKWLDKEDAEVIALQFGYTPSRNIKAVKEFTIE